MPDSKSPIAILAMEALAREKKSSYPEPFAFRMEGREKKPLSEVFGLFQLWN